MSNSLIYLRIEFNSLSDLHCCVSLSRHIGKRNKHFSPQIKILLKYKLSKSVKKWTVNLMIAGGWLWSIFMALPPLMGWGIYLPESNGMRFVHLGNGEVRCVLILLFCSCVPGWKSVNGRGYNMFLLVFAFFIPLLIMILTSVSKYRYLNKVM